MLCNIIHIYQHLYVIIFRISNNGKNILCGSPCENCQKILRNGIKKKGYTLNRVYYTDKIYDKMKYIKKSNLRK